MRVSFAAILLSVALYQCLAIHMPPSIITGPEMTKEGPQKHRIYEVYDRISLQCVATADPEPDYVWYHNGVSLFDREGCNLSLRNNIIKDPSKPGTGSIVVTEAYSVAEGYYQCQAENKYGIAMSQVVFLQLARFESDYESFQDYLIPEGQPLKLPCVTGRNLSIPAAEYFWGDSYACDQKSADIVFVLDESASIRGPDFDKLIKFVEDVVNLFDVTKGMTHIGTMTFESTPHVHFQLDEFHRKKDISMALSQISQSRGGTKTFDALDTMRTDMFSATHARMDVVRIGILITAGASEDAEKTKAAARKALDAGITMLAIGVGRRIDPGELYKIAHFTGNVFIVINYSDLQWLKEPLAKTACEVTTLPPTATTTTTTTTTTITTPPTTTLPQSIPELSKRITTDGKGNLYFSYVTREDAELYECSRYNRILQRETPSSLHWVGVSKGPAPNLPPENMYCTPDVIVIEGTELQLMCFFQGKPEVTISWERNTSVDLPSHHRVQNFTTRLVINPVALDDEAVYKCTGVNVMGSATQEINVKVEAKPEFERDSDKPRDQTVTEGDTAEFRCSTFAIPDSKVEWFTNGRPLEDAKSGDRYHISEDGRTLTISDVCIDCSDGEWDIGNIQCNASNGHGYVYDGAYLRILRRTTITVGPTDKDMKYGEGETVVLKCLATSDASTSFINEWYLDGIPIDYNESVIWTEEHRLVIKAETVEVAKKYVGEYTCVASNGYSTANASASVRFPTKNSGSGTMTPTASALSAVAGGLLLLILVVVCVFIYLRWRACPCNVVSKSRDTVLEAVYSNETANARLDQLLHSTFDEDMLLKLNRLRIPRACITLAQQIGKGSRKIEDVIPILAEALVMGELRHRHVMGLLGVVIDAEPLLVLPFMQNGNLHSYLRSSRFGDSTDIKLVEPHQLLVFGRQIAKGMDYLGSQRIVHRDLACRNCMLTANLVVKVADFGLSKDVYETNYYRQLKESRLPIKWLAVESLVDRVFSTQSDVWAYGVTLWEVCTMARIPYPSLDNSEVLTYVKNGGRMEQPDDCPDQIFSLMTECWDQDPSKRPTFSDLAESIDQYLAEEMGYLEVTGPDDADPDDPDDLPLLYEVDHGDDGNSDDNGVEDRASDGDPIVVLNMQTTSL